MLRRTVIACAIMVVWCAAPSMALADPTDRTAADDCPGAAAVAADESARRQATGSVLCLVNRERALHGAAAVRTSGTLVSAALGHSGEMVANGYFSHTSMGGAGLRERATRSGYIRRSRYTLVGETIAWGMGTYATPSQLVESFLESAPHRRALLDRRFRDVGVGLVIGAPATDVAGAAATLTLDFGRR
jgi:uncharacterized protein YkwD